ncbi:hypothetical protein [Acinetobacter terrae]|uniref:Prepilin-type N-terminal cleavage/methylation domain-containing protein n=1 Tax=Acinetobacter terrae TaxID=2731247 RepID=A0ABX1V760_9GAMM|nr:hypothetical protein [Acinetobacter terrae]NNH88239.1 hypothetical protein [Acinetobacter terrae]
MDNLKFSQRGISLIEILIALALSIIIILAMLRAFVTTGKVTTEASLGAKVDSHIMLGLIATDRILQGLGYGLTNPTAADFSVLDEDGDAVVLGQAGKFLVWKISTTHCQALQSHTSGLYLYGKTDVGYSCSSLAKPADTISKELLIQIDHTALNSSGIANTTNKIGGIDIKVEQVTGGCSPFGVKGDSSMPLGKYQVTLLANTYAASTDSSARTVKNITCLFNFK